jgi:hypothetical protein
VVARRSHSKVVGGGDPESTGVRDAWRFFPACPEKLGIANLPGVRFIVILERDLFYETKNDRGQDREAPELLVDIRCWMIHNALKLMCFIDYRWNAGA